GFLNFGQLPNAGTYQITLSSEAWIDVIQDGRRVEPIAIGGGAADCSVPRRTRRYELSSQPVLLQVAGASTDHVALTVRQIPLQVATLQPQPNMSVALTGPSETAPAAAAAAPEAAAATI